MTNKDLQELVSIIVLKKNRCEQALKSSSTSQALKDRVLQAEYNTYVLALEGAKALQQKNTSQVGQTGTKSESELVKTAE